MTNCITGASGFIGRHLISKLASPVICMSRDQDGRYYPPSTPRVFFLAAYGNLWHQTDAGEMVEANIRRPYQMACGMAKGGPHKFVYVSTSSVGLPVQTPYSATKGCAETLLRSIPGLSLVIVRPFTVVGVGEQKEHLIPKLIRSCMEGTEMPFVAEPRHDYVDVDDLADGIIAAAGETKVGPFELGTGECYSNAQVLEMVQEITGRKANVVPVESMRPYDTADWKAKGFAAWPGDWFPKRNLYDSITGMVNTYKNAH